MTLDIILWLVLAAAFCAFVVIGVRVRRDLAIWKTKKDFDFDELDRILGAQEYKYEVSKYLHKYKSNRRDYENRIARMVGVLVLAGLVALADGIVLAVRHLF